MISTKNVKRATGLAMTAALCVTGLGLIAPTASFAVDAGTLTFTPATGTSSTAMEVITSGPCTNPAATNLEVVFAGSGFPASGQIAVGNSAISAYSVGANGGYIVPLTETMKDYAAQQATPATLSGKYPFRLFCRTNTDATDLGDFGGAIYFTSSTAYQSTAPAATQSVLLKTFSNKQIGNGMGQVVVHATVTPANSAKSVTFYRRSGLTHKVVPEGDATPVNGVVSRTITTKSGTIQDLYAVVRPNPGFKQIYSGDISYKVA